jgi:hypothetical protein
MFRGLTVIVVALHCCSITARAGDKPAAPAAPPFHGEPAVTIAEMRVQTVPALTYVYADVETTFAGMGEPVKAAFAKDIQGAMTANLHAARTMMVYPTNNPHMSPDKPFKAEVGIVLWTELAQAPEGLKVRKTEPFKCVSIIYTGPVNRQGEAYQKLVPAMRAAGHQPTGEEREACLDWEGMESPNNVFIMQIGIK